MNKSFLYWNSSHTLLRMPQGIPSEVPELIGPASTSDEIMDFNTNCIFHVSNQSGTPEAVHLFASSKSECVVFVRIVPASMLTSNGDKSRLGSWPSRFDAIRVRIRKNQPSPVCLLQGHVVQGGACVSLSCSKPGCFAFGFAVDLPR